jgi:hypothetical protein
MFQRIKSSGSASSASKEASGSATDSHADRVKVVRELAQFLDDSMETLQGNLSADLYNTFNTQLGTNLFVCSDNKNEAFSVLIA